MSSILATSNDAPPVIRGYWSFDDQHVEVEFEPQAGQYFAYVYTEGLTESGPTDSSGTQTSWAPVWAWIQATLKNDHPDRDGRRCLLHDVRAVMEDGWRVKSFTEGFDFVYDSLMPTRGAPMESAYLTLTNGEWMIHIAFGMGLNICAEVQFEKDDGNGQPEYYKGFPILPRLQTTVDNFEIWLDRKRQ
jgi:hypothetical protein